MNTKPESPEYKAFENLLGEVLSVSKTELSARIEQEKREKGEHATARVSRVSGVPAKHS